jgi:hypothetical protein
MGQNPKSRGKKRGSPYSVGARRRRLQHYKLLWQRMWLGGRVKIQGPGAREGGRNDPNIVCTYE